MINKHSSRNRGLSILLVCSGVLFFPGAHASSGGFVSGGSGCSGCHSSGAVDVLISGPQVVEVGSTHSFTVSITGGPASVGGINLAAIAGLLSATQSGTEIRDGELVQSSSTTFSGDTVSWDFAWTAPDVQGSVDFLAAGISANGDFGTGGDFAGITSFTVQVVPIPAGLLLLSSGVALMGWFRRRSPG